MFCANALLGKRGFNLHSWNCLHVTNLITAEDALEEAKAKHARQGKARMENVFDPDYSLDDHFGRVGKRGGQGGVGAPKAGYGKRVNPNDVRSRPKRC